MKVVSLPVEQRERFGSCENRRLRKKGRLPVVLYGLGRDPAHLSVEAHSFGLMFRRGQRMFELSAGADTQMCLLKDVQFDALGDNLIHADLFRVDDKHTVEVDASIEFIGQADSPSGAVMDIIRHAVQVRCLPRAIPDQIELSISDLEVGNRITAGDLNLPEGVELVERPEATIVTHHFLHGSAAEGQSTEEIEDGGEEAPTEPAPSEE